MGPGAILELGRLGIALFFHIHNLDSHFLVAKLEFFHKSLFQSGIFVSSWWLG